MSDAPEQVQPVAVEPSADLAIVPPADVVVPEAVSLAPVADPTPVVVPAPNSGPRPPVRDRLRKRQIKKELVDLGDDLLIEVRGLSTDAAFDMGETLTQNTAPDEETSPKAATVAMLRSTCFDPDSGESVFGTNPEADGYFTDEEILAQPIDITNKLAEAGNRVLGRDGAPGKD